METSIATLAPPLPPLPLDQPPAVIARPSPRADAARRAASRWAGHAVLALLAVMVGVFGIDLRVWVWRASEPVRYVLDIDNAFRQGTRTLNVGYVERYDHNATDRAREWALLSLDYGPGRLAIATLWTRWVRTQIATPGTADQWNAEFYPRAIALGRTYELCRPMLWVNLAGEALSAVAMFCLVRRYASFGGRRPARGNVLGLVAVSLFWLNPALLSNAHAWPQWDSWVLPFTLWGLLFASLDCWFYAGVTIALGAMFKGQILFGAPMFLLWPLWQRRIGAAGRWLSGLAFGVAAETAVWLVREPGRLDGNAYVPGHTNPAAVHWAIAMAIALGLVIVAVRGWLPRRTKPAEPEAIPDAPSAAPPRARRWRWRWAIRASLVIAAVLLVGVPLHNAGLHAAAWIAPLAVGLLAASVRLLRAGSLGYVLAGWVAAALLVCPAVFGTSANWFYTGIAHGTTARAGMSMGPNNNLPKLLEDQWGWKLEDPAITLPAGPTANRVRDFLRAVDRNVRLPDDQPVALPMKYLLLLVWVAVVVVCSFAVARHDRRRDPRFLLAVAVPWVAMFAVMAQMHQRYLLWGACLTAMAVAVSPGLALLHLLISFVAAGQELVSMADNQYGEGEAGRALWRTDHRTLLSILHGWTPGMAWAIVLTTLIFLYAAVVPGWRHHAPLHAAATSRRRKNAQRIAGVRADAANVVA